MKVKITVVKKLLLSEFLDEIDYTVEENKNFGECSKFNVGDEFVLDSIDEFPPSGFCPWAWCDIQRDVAMILFGAEPEPRMKNSHSMYASCDEGLRPVIFKIERIEF